MGNGSAFERYQYKSQQEAANPTDADLAKWQRQAAGLDDIEEVDELPAPPRKDIPAADLELLQLAARALGARLEEVDGEGYGNLHFEDGSTIYAWNSLVHSDDAFNLAVRLQLTVRNEHLSAGVAYCTAGDEAEGPFTVFPSVRSGGNESKVIDEDFAATRRAITCAAAEIGKTVA